MLLRDPETMRNLAINLHVWLAETGVTPNALQRTAGLSSATMCRLLRVPPAVTLGTVHRLAGVMGWSVERLLAPASGPAAQTAASLIALAARVEGRGEAPRFPTPDASAQPVLPTFMPTGAASSAPGEPPRRSEAPVLVSLADIPARPTASLDAQARAAVARALEQALLAVRA
jgi:hypothetical protein